MKIMNLDLVSMAEIGGNFFSVSSRSLSVSVRNSRSRLDERDWIGETLILVSRLKKRLSLTTDLFTITIFRVTFLKPTPLSWATHKLSSYLLRYHNHYHHKYHEWLKNHPLTCSWRISVASWLARSFHDTWNYQQSCNWSQKYSNRQ